METITIFRRAVLEAMRVADYHPTLIKRTKWIGNQERIKVADVVVVVDPNFPQKTWPKGRILVVKLEKEGVARSATVQTEHSTLDRPLVKIAKLDVQD